jgi:hypothetical protein
VQETPAYNPRVPKATSKRPVAKPRRLPTTSAPIGGDQITGLLPQTANYAVAEQIDVNKPLTDMQRQFVKMLASGESNTTAAMRAGYENPNIAYRMLRMPNILAALERERELWREAALITKGNVIDMMKEAYDMAKLTSEPHAMVSAAKEIGRILGYYEPVKRKLEITVTGNARLDKLNELSNEELAKLVAEAPDALTDTLEAITDEMDQEDES